jgi:hypothetical protein
MKIDKIYVDMDGVIANFNAAYKARFNMFPEETRDRKEFYGLFETFIAEDGFYKLDLMPDARRLIDFLDILNIPKEILSSTARDQFHSVIAPQKARWLATHNIAYPQNFVPGKQHKYKYATPNSIIIDDTLSIIEDWNKAGGIGILHKNADYTINIIKSYI